MFHEPLLALDPVAWGDFMDPKNTNIIDSFEALKRTAPNGAEYWMARDLQAALGYIRWDRLANAIERARAACAGSGEDANHHLLGTGKMITAGKGARRERRDYFLSRYGAYLLAMNGDPSKPEVAAAQTYFAVQTRRSEVRDAAQRRLDMRDRVRVANRSLAAAATAAGVPSKRFGIFQNAGYQGLYGGLGLREIKQHKQIPHRDELLDRAGEVELAANYFRVTQAGQKIARERISDERVATAAHREVGAKVRETIREMGGIAPEDLPVEPHIKLVKKSLAKEIEAGG